MKICVCRYMYVYPLIHTYEHSEEEGVKSKKRKGCNHQMFTFEAQHCSILTRGQNFR